MKLKKNIPALLLLVIFCVCLAAPALAAVPGETAFWGRTISAPRISGSLILSDTSCLDSVSVSPGEGPFSYESGSDEAGAWTFSVSGVVREGIDPGTYTIGHLDVNRMDAEGQSLGYLYVPIVIRVDPVPTPEPTAEPTPEPTKRPYTGPYVDQSELKALIAECEALQETDYTVADWEMLTEVLEEASEVLQKSWDQQKINEAAQTLKEAMATVVPLDRSALQAALDEADSLLTYDGFGSLYAELLTVLSPGRAAMEAREQAQIDEQAAQLQDVLHRIQVIRDNYSVVVEKEIVKEKLVEAEAPPVQEKTTAFRYWPVLFAGSALVNLVLVLVLIRRKKKAVEIPLAKYNMDEDF